MPRNTDTIEISVRELVSKFFTGGDLVFNSADTSSAIDGSKIHNLWQKSRKEKYQSEVSVDHIFNQYEPTIRIRGRIDGLYPARKVITIEEIKSTTLNPHKCAENLPQSHVAQLMVYGYLYGLQEKWSNSESICLNLVYVQAELKDFAISNQICRLDQLE